MRAPSLARAAAPPPASEGEWLGYDHGVITGVIRACGGAARRISAGRGGGRGAGGRTDGRCRGVGFAARGAGRGARGGVHARESATIGASTAEHSELGWQICMTSGAVWLARPYLV